MKTRSTIAIVISLMSIVLVVAGCGGTKSSATSSTPVPTTSAATSKPATTSTTPAPTSSTPVVSSSTPAGGILPTTPTPMTNHTAAVLKSYNGLCMMCHATGTTNAFPTTPSWNGAANGATVNKGTYTVAAGSPADHTGRTVDTCTTQAGCHVAPGT